MRRCGDTMKDFIKCADNFMLVNNLKSIICSNNKDNKIICKIGKYECEKK